MKYELGTLYFRLGSYALAKRYFLEALATPAVDAATKARIEASLQTVDKQSQPSRFSGFAQTGLRYQTNASFVPSSNTVRFNGIDFGLPPTNGGKSDTNWFGLVGLSHDYDLQDQGGTVLETRFIGYLTQQFRLHDLDVGLFDVSFGPRFSFPSEWIPGASVKPYVVGGSAWVDGARYLSSGGAGLSFEIPTRWGATLEPSFEWRRANYVTGDPVLAEFNSGDWFTVALGSTVPINDRLKLDARAYYRRGDASMNFQSFNQFAHRRGSVLRICPAARLDPAKLDDFSLCAAGPDELRCSEPLHRSLDHQFRERMGGRRHLGHADHRDLRHRDDDPVRPQLFAASELPPEQSFDPVRAYGSVLRG